MLVYVPEAADIEKEALDLLKSHGHELVYTEPQARARAESVGALLIRTYTRVDAEFLSGFPHVRFVMRAGVGLDNIDVATCKERGIAVINAPGSNANAVAEYVVGAIILLIRKIAPQEALLRQGQWRSSAYTGTELKNRTLGLVGCGNVGMRIARKLSGWDMNIIGFDPYLTAQNMHDSGIRKAELNEVLSGSDIISLHVPLVPETQHMIDVEAFGRMKEGVILINAARGGIVDETALMEALKRGRVAAAALDVFEHEPVVGEDLKASTSLLLTPHIAGYTHEANKEMCAAPVREFLRRLESDVRD